MCFNVGAKCDELCRCRNCENQEVEEEEGEETFLTDVVVGNGEVKNKVIVEPPTKYVKVASMGTAVAAASSISDSESGSGSASHQTTSHDLLYPLQQQQQQDVYQMQSIIQGEYMVCGESSQACTPDIETIQNAGLWAEI